MDMTPSSIEIEYGVSRPRRLGNHFESKVTEFSCKEDAEKAVERDGGVLVCRTVIRTGWTLADDEEVTEQW
jgi:hypothetical protein